MLVTNVNFLVFDCDKDNVCQVLSLLLLIAFCVHCLLLCFCWFFVCDHFNNVSLEEFPKLVDEKNKEDFDKMAENIFEITMISEEVNEN